MEYNEIEQRLPLYDITEEIIPDDKEKYFNVKILEINYDD